MNDFQINIRPAKPTEADILTKIAFKSKASWGYSNEWLEKWRDQLTVTKKHIQEWVCLVAESDGQVVGFWCREPIQSEDVTGGFLFVDPAFHGKGIARKLWNVLLTLLKSKGVKSFTIEADPNAMPFYLKIGGEVIREISSSTIKDRTIPIIKIPVD